MAVFADVFMAELLSFPICLAHSGDRRHEVLDQGIDGCGVRHPRCVPGQQESIDDGMG
jgi:hypothetical protein